MSAADLGAGDRLEAAFAREERRIFVRRDSRLVADRSWA